MRKWYKGVVGAAVAVSFLVPAGVALAAQVQHQAQGPQATNPCTGDQQRDMLQLHDGSWYLTVGGPEMNRFGGPQLHGELGVPGPHTHGPQGGFGYQWGQVL